MYIEQVSVCTWVCARSRAIWCRSSHCIREMGHSMSSVRCRTSDHSRRMFRQEKSELTRMKDENGRSALATRSTILRRGIGRLEFCRIAVLDSALRACFWSSKMLMMDTHTHTHTHTHITFVGQLVMGGGDDQVRGRFDI